MVNFRINGALVFKSFLFLVDGSKIVVLFNCKTWTLDGVERVKIIFL